MLRPTVPGVGRVDRSSPTRSRAADRSTSCTSSASCKRSRALQRCRAVREGLTPGQNGVDIVPLKTIGLWMNGGLAARFPSDPPPRRALWKRPALECRTVLPAPVRSHVNPSRGSVCGGSIFAEPFRHAGVGLQHHAVGRIAGPGHVGADVDLIQRLARRADRGRRVVPLTSRRVVQPRRLARVVSRRIEVRDLVVGPGSTASTAGTERRSRTSSDALGCQVSWPYHSDHH